MRLIYILGTKWNCEGVLMWKCPKFYLTEIKYWAKKAKQTKKIISRYQNEQESRSIRKKVVP